MRGALLLALLVAVWPAAAQAGDRMLGAFGAWRAWRGDQGGQQVCYMVTGRTVKSTGPRRGARYLMITHRPVEASTDVFSYGAGASLDSRHPPRLTVARKTFELFSVGGIAWSRDAMTDHHIAAAVIAAPRAQVTGFILDGKNRRRAIGDIFDLTGAKAAYAAIGRACGLIRPAKKPHRRAKKRQFPPEKRRPAPRRRP